eukprot:304710-Amphidinium_carterae.1
MFWRLEIPKYIRRFALIPTSICPRCPKRTLQRFADIAPGGVGDPHPEEGETKRTSTMCKQLKSNFDQRWQNSI